MKKLLLILCFAPSVASSATEKEIAYLELLNYRLNMMAVNNEMADSLAVIASELKMIRCKIKPIESDCKELVKESGNGDVQ